MKIAFKFILFLLLICCSKRNTTIGIQPYGEFEKELIDTIASAVSKIYDFKVVVLPARSLPKDAFVNIKIPRFRADSLLLDLKKLKADSLDYVLGLTSEDISTTKRGKHGKIKIPESKYSDWGIFGLGYQPGPACIVSTFRLKCGNRELFLSRIKKVCIHELGHNLGLKHCLTKKCVMQDAAETIKTIDAVNPELCSHCRKKLK